MSESRRVSRIGLEQHPAGWREEEEEKKETEKEEQLDGRRTKTALEPVHGCCRARKEGRCAEEKIKEERPGVVTRK